MIGIEHLKALFFATANFLAVVSHGMDVPLYWGGESNLVAAVVSYEKDAILQNGEKVRLFTANIDKDYTNFEAIVFQVVSPHKFAGWFFRLENMPSAWGTAEGGWPLKYQIGELYYFPIQTASGLFRIGTETQEFADTVVHNPGHKYFTSVKSATEQLHDFENRIDALSKIAFSLEEELKQEPAPRGSPEHFWWRKKKGRYIDIKDTIKGLESRKEEVQRQIIHLKQMEERSLKGKDKQ